MVIHMEDKLTTVLIPQRSYPQIQKALQMSNTPVLALGGNFSPTADSHLVAVQRDEDEPSKNPMNNSDYETQAINIQNKARKGVFMILFCFCFVFYWNCFKNSKVFEQKGDLLNFKANIDPMAVLSQAEPS